jgi:predicted ATPase
MTGELSASSSRHYSRSRHIETFAPLARINSLPMWMAFSSFVEPWARWHLGDQEGSVMEMRRGIELWRELAGPLNTPLLMARLAEVEAETGEIDISLERIDDAFAESERTGQRWFDAELHRTRGEILLKQNPANSAPAEEALLSAIAIARHQKARSFELRAALSLAKLYRACRRDDEADAALGPALDRFAATPELPEIEEGAV